MRQGLFVFGLALAIGGLFCVWMSAGLVNGGMVLGAPLMLAGVYVVSRAVTRV